MPCVFLLSVNADNIRSNFDIWNSDPELTRGRGMIYLEMTSVLQVDFLVSRYIKMSVTNVALHILPVMDDTAYQTFECQRLGGIKWKKGWAIDNLFEYSIGLSDRNLKTVMRKELVDDFEISLKVHRY